MREALGFRGSGFRVVSFRLQGARNLGQATVKCLV